MIEPNSDTQRLTAEQIRGKAEYKRWFACAVDPEGTAITPALSGQPLGSRETSWRRSHSPAIRSLLLPSGTTCQCTATAFRYGTQKVHGPVSTSHSQRSSLGPARERSLFPTPRDPLDDRSRLFDQTTLGGVCNGQATCRRRLELEILAGEPFTP